MSRSPVCGQRRPSRADEPALDRERPLELDQLLGDRPRQRLPRLGAAVDAQRAGARAPPGRSAGRREALVERPQVVVDAEREAHPLDRRGGRRPRVAAGREQHALAARSARPPRAPARRRRAAAACSVAPRRRRMPSPRAAPDAERPRRRHLDPQLDRRVSARARRSIAPEQVDVDQERVARDDLAERALLRLRRRAGRVARRRDDRGDGHGAGDEAGRGERGGLTGGQRRGDRAARARACGRRRRAGRRPPRSLDDVFLWDCSMSGSSVTRPQHDAPECDARRATASGVAVPNTQSQYGALTPKPRSSSWKWWRMCSSRSRRPTRVRGRWWCTW